MFDNVKTFDSDTTGNAELQVECIAPESPRVRYTVMNLKF